MYSFTISVNSSLDINSARLEESTKRSLRMLVAEVLGLIT